MDVGFKDVETCNVMVGNRKEHLELSRVDNKFHAVHMVLTIRFKQFVDFFQDYFHSLIISI